MNFLPFAIIFALFSISVSANGGHVCISEFVTNNYTEGHISDVSMFNKYVNGQYSYVGVDFEMDALVPKDIKITNYHVYKAPETVYPNIGDSRRGLSLILYHPSSLNGSIDIRIMFSDKTSVRLATDCETKDCKQFYLPTEQEVETSVLTGCTK